MEIFSHMCFIVIVIILIVITQANVAEINQLKCTENDPRDIYEGCMLDYRDMALWCDRTNLTCVPDPKTIRSQAPCQRAVYLYMNDSCLSHIEADMLKQYVSLKFADFSKNLLTHIANYTFISTNHMILLDLSENKISEIDEDAFTEVDQLEYIKLYNNLLYHLQPGVFKNMGNLQKIDLSSNHLDTLDWSWFSSEVSLEILNITRNNVSSLRQPLAEQVKHLTQLDFGENRLQNLYRRNLAYMQKLQNLHLRRNQLTIIDEDAFADTPNLVTVDLRDNMLHSLPINLFKNLCNLQQLFLSGNALVTVNSDWFVNVFRHNYINPTSMTSEMLSGNKWSCDCKMLLYWEMLQTMKKDFQSSNSARIFDIECAAPKELHGRNLTTVQKHQLISDGGCDDSVNSSKNTFSSYSDNENRKTPVDNLLSRKCLSGELSSSGSVYTTAASSSSSNLQDLSLITQNVKTEGPSKESDNNLILILIIILIIALTLFILVLYYQLRKKNRSKNAMKEDKKKRHESNKDDDISKLDEAKLLA